MRQKSILVDPRSSSRYFNGAARQDKQKYLLDDEMDTRRNTMNTEDTGSMFVQIPVYFNESAPVSSENLISMRDNNASTESFSEDEISELEDNATKIFNEHDGSSESKKTSSVNLDVIEASKNEKHASLITPRLLMLSMLEELISSIITIVLLIIVTLEFVSNWNSLRKLQADVNFIKYVAILFIFGNLYTTNTLFFSKHVMITYILNVILFFEEVCAYSYLIFFLNEKQKAFSTTNSSSNSILGNSSAMITSGLYSEIKIILILLIVTKIVSMCLKSILLFFQIKTKTIGSTDIHLVLFRLTYFSSPLVIFANFMYGEMKDPFNIFSIFAVLLSLLQVIFMKSSRFPRFLFNSSLIYLCFMNIQTVIRFGGERCLILSAFNLALFLMSAFLLFYYNSKMDIKEETNDFIEKDNDEKRIDDSSSNTRRLIRDIKRLKIINICLCISMTIVINIMNIIVEKIMNFEPSWIILNVFNILFVPVLFIILELQTYKFSESRKIIGFANKISSTSQFMIISVTFLEFLMFNMYCLVIISKVYNYMPMELVTCLLIFIYTAIISYIYKNFIAINQKINSLKRDKNSELYYFDVESDPFDYIDPSSSRFSKLIRLIITPLLQIATINSIIPIILSINKNMQEPLCVFTLFMNFAIFCSCYFMSSFYERMNLDILGNKFKINQLMGIHTLILLISILMFILNIVIGSNIRTRSLDIFNIENSIICYFLIFSDVCWGFILASLGFISYRIVWGYYKGNFSKY